MNPIKLQVFCNSLGGQSNLPNQSVKMVGLLGIPSANDANGRKVGTNPNAAVFKDGEGNVALNMANVTKEIAQQFEEGKTYVVTITEAV